VVEKIGILHPGQMGISVAATVKNSGFDVMWVSDSRSDATRGRAESQDLEDARTLKHLCKKCTIIISVCPPGAAVDLAGDVLRNGFRGLYLDANAISPQHSRQIEDRMVTHGTTYVDGGIIGGPAWEPGKTWLYLSGAEAKRVENIFSGGPLETKIISHQAGHASALKMCFAAYTKGTTALLCAILAAAEGLGVREALEEQWSKGGSDFTLKTHQGLRRVTAKAWRFEGEMEEISTTFESVGIPGGFHEAAASIYKRLRFFKGMNDVPSLDDVLMALLDG
jgi:3-hydroxyisobutyrate dehydrogenase-like beta-hydroxyacid dehydrogenase